jgi:hypothetical protein
MTNRPVVHLAVALTLVSLFAAPGAAQTRADDVAKQQEEKAGASAAYRPSRHSLLLSGELRLFPNRVGLDMALFVDAGNVAPFRSRLLTFNDLTTDGPPHALAPAPKGTMTGNLPT